jgi:hypothetical protein
MSLDDVSCFLHLPIDGMLLFHEGMTRDEAVEIMIWHLGDDPGDVIKEVTEIRGVHACFSYLRKIFKQRLLQQLGAQNEGDMEEVQKLRRTLSAYICCTWW